MLKKPCEKKKALRISIAYVITTVIIFKFNFHIWFTSQRLYAYFPFFEDLLLFVPNCLFIAGFFDSEKDFFWNFRNCLLQGEAC